MNFLICSIVPHPQSLRPIHRQMNHIILQQAAKLSQEKQPSRPNNKKQRNNLLLRVCHQLSKDLLRNYQVVLVIVPQINREVIIQLL